MSAAPILTILKDGEQVKSLPIEGEAVLGRAEGCVIRLEDRAISRQHAVFRKTSDGVQIEKKSEFAPLVINGAEATRAIVKEGDVIAIGPYLMRTSLPKESVATPTPPAAPIETADIAAQAAPVLEPLGDEAVLAALDASTPEPAPESAATETPHGEALLPFDPPPPEEQQGIALDAPGSDVVGNGIGVSDGPAEIDVQEPYDEDAKTKLTPAAKVAVKLVFQPGTANHTEFELSQDEISIGRGSNCDIVLNDKKASRKNSIIRRVGMNFLIKDLDSANGTFVNGVKVQEQELSGDDLIRVGGVEFEFKALNKDYAAREKDFMSLPEEPEAPAEMQAPMAFDPAMDGAAALPAPTDGQLNGMIPVGPAGDAIGGAVPGITGLSENAGKKKSLMERFRALPPKKRLLYGLAGIFLLYTLTEEDPEPETKKGPAKKVGVSGPSGAKAPVMTFEALPPEQRQFVDSQFTLASDHFKNRAYDDAIYALKKIFAILPDYKNAKEIYRYAEEGKRRMQALQEEQQRKEEAERLKAKINQLVEEIGEKMGKKQYAEAKELFPQLVAIDPDNARVAQWKIEIDEFEEGQKRETAEKAVQSEINQRAWTIYKEGMDLKKRGKFHTAIATFAKVEDIGASEKKVTSLAKLQIKKCRAAIVALRDPVLAEAKQKEDAGELVTAFKLYQKATKIDPPHPAGYAGMGRIKNVLHDRAKVIYTEAILAESYSDFETAKRKFNECLDTAPADDIYHERAKRKLSHYFRKEEPAH